MAAKIAGDDEEGASVDGSTAVEEDAAEELLTGRASPAP